jgi:peptide/nickel transport system permease protein/oligopeptide transport system permease protein
MTLYVLRRVIGVPVTALAVLTVLFFLLRIVPGDPAILILGEFASPERVAALHRQLGLDQPLIVQYFAYLGDVVRGDFGNSLRSGRPVFAEITEVLPHTLILAAGGVLLSILLGIPLGVVAAVRRGRAADTAASLLCLLGQSMPVFLLGLGLLLVFSYYLGWLPVIGAGQLGQPRMVVLHLILPAATIGLTVMGPIGRMTRSSIVDTLGQDYIRTARAKGLADPAVVYKHAFRNALLPVVTVAALNFGYLIGGAVVTETMFARPGLGRLLMDAIFARDYPQIEAVVVVFSLGFIAINLLTDLLYGVIDPRVAVEKR